mgnify:CR=1 FL=1
MEAATGLGTVGIGVTANNIPVQRIGNGGYLYGIVQRKKNSPSEKQPEDKLTAGAWAGETAQLCHFTVDFGAVVIRAASGDSDVKSHRL